MAATKWSQFFWSDWLNDEKLRMCSRAAKGLWMDMLCLMAQSDSPGFLAVNGRKIADDELPHMLAGNQAEVAGLLAELERNGVFSRNKAGTIYCRRMCRAANVSAARSKAANERWGRAKGGPDGGGGDQQPRRGRENRGRIEGESGENSRRITGTINGGTGAQSNLENARQNNAQPDLHMQNACNGDANGDANAMQALGTTNNQYSNSSSSSTLHRDSPAREPTPAMPAVTDPAHRWAFLADKEEIDDRMVRRPICAGWCLDIVCQDIAQALGVTDPRWRTDWWPVVRWLKDGLNPNKIILPAIRDVMARPNRPEQIRSLAYFDQAVRGYRRAA